jgi:thiol-disulfide isomerase/thioredoxin
MLALTACAHAPVGEGDEAIPAEAFADVVRKAVRATQEGSLPRENMHLPKLNGSAWINSQPLTVNDLRGKVVLLDIWDYTCVNCIRTLPYIKDWYQRYVDRGLVIIGVHAPEFPFATEKKNVQRAVEAFGIEYPVVLDNEYEIWSSLNNHVWPAKYFFDHNLRLRSWHFGEGAYAESERGIRALLRERAPEVELPPLAESSALGGGGGAFCAPVTPELYLGYRRGRPGNPGGLARDVPKRYELPAQRTPDMFYLEGEFTATPWSLRYEGGADGPGRLLLDYEALEVNLVLHPPPEGVGKLALVQDAAPLRPELAREELQYPAETEAASESGPDNLPQLMVDVPRMYRLVGNPGVVRHTLELVFLTPGTEAFAFTFTSCD